MKRYLLFLSLLALLMSGCQPGEPEEEKTGEPAAPAFSLSDSLQAHLGGWVAYYRAQLDSFDVQKFHLVDSLRKDTLLTQQYDPNRLDNLMDLYQDYLVFSPDSTRVLDLYSYRYIFDPQEGAPPRLMKDVDVEAALVNLEKEQRRRLLFLGPSGYADDAAWLGNDKMLITGGMVEAHDPSLVQLKVWLIDLKNRKWYTYDYADLIEGSRVAYVEEVIFIDMEVM